MLYRFLSRISFLWNSKNQHGVHSPFVFAYVTRCLYGKQRYSAHKTENILLKSIAYFKPEYVELLQGNPILEEKINTVAPTVRLGTGNRSNCLIYMEQLTEASLLYLIQKRGTKDSGTILIVQGPYGNKGHSSLWERLKQWEKVTVTVDMFHCAAVFFRPEQAKQHFKIRI
ncbi:MAG: hypothetical protein V7724_10200 [Sediminicola sp.]